MQKAAAVFVRIWTGVNHPLDSSIYDHLGASDAWLMRYKDLAAGCTNAVQSCLNDGVLLSVQRTQAVAVYDQMPDVIAVGQTGGGAVIAGRQNALVADDYRANMCAIAGTARCHSEGDLEEILIPGWPMRGTATSGT